MMKLTRILPAFALSALFLMSPLVGNAQNAATPPCDGSITTVRVSATKPGAIDAFLAAVAAHKAWYKSHGLTSDVIVASRVIDTSDKSKGAVYSASEVVTYHVYPPNSKAPVHDAAWDAYVKQYRDSSDIKSEYNTCMPKLVP